MDGHPSYPAALLGVVDAAYARPDIAADVLRAADDFDLLERQIAGDAEAGAGPATDMIERRDAARKALSVALARLRLMTEDATSDDHDLVDEACRA